MSYSSYNEFRSLVKTQGLVTASHFSVILPSIVDGQDTKTISMQCEMSALPGLNIMTNELRAFGEITEYAYGVTYPGISMSFYVTQDFDTRTYFREWMRKVFDNDSRTVGYYTSYVKPITILVQDRSGKEVHKVVLHEAFPKSIADISLAYSDHSPLKVNVMIQYKWWSNSEASMGPPAPPTPGRASEGLANGTGVIGGINFGSAASFANPFNTNLPTSIGSGFSDISDFLPPNPFLNVGAAMAQNGPIIGADILASSNSAAKAISSSGLGAVAVPGSGSVGSTLGNLTKSMGTGFNNFGGNLVQLGRNLTELTAPVAALKGTIVTISNTTTQLGALADALGVKDSGFQKISQRLGEANAKLGPLTTIGGVSSGLSSVGASMSAINTSMGVLSKTVGNLPGATSAATESLTKLGGMVGMHSSNVNNMASELSNLDGL
jgi:hypothetical protein